jgi:hypothetical protein
MLIGDVTSSVTRRALLVLGMHRSGTSALTGLLVHLGAQGPRTLMGANEYNERGYWESAPFHDYHERLLQAAGTEWDLWTPVDLGRLDPGVAAQFDAEFQTLLAQEFGAAPLFVMKDPRVCRLVPFWCRQLSAAGVEPAAILVVRHPLEVAQSLAARDGLSLEHALLLWLRHVLDAEAGTRTMRRTVIRYEDVLANWAEATRSIGADLGVDWPAPSAEIDARIAVFLGSDLRHHVSTAESPEVAPLLQDWIRRTSDALEQLLGPDASGRIEAMEGFDQVRCEFDRSVDVFGPAASERDHTLRQVEGLLDQARQQSAALQSELAGVAQQRNDLDRTRRDLSAQLEALTRRLQTSDNRVRALEQSRSWRWTAPFRAVPGWLRSLVGQGRPGRV